MMAEDPPLIVIVGPTAVGKTSLAVELCQDFDGEVVSADSRQIYRHMDVGTAKPSPEQQRRAPHHLIDIIDPDEDFTLAVYQRLAYEAIDEIHSRGSVPFLVGGTGLYVEAVVEGFQIPEVAPNEELREELRELAEERGEQHLHQRLEEVDPEAAMDIHPHNVRRVVRALEVYMETGEPISGLRGKKPPPYRILTIGLNMAREKLYERINARVDRMIEEGLLKEVQKLVEQGYGCDLPAMSGLGYAQICSYLGGEIDLEEAVRRTKRDTRRFVQKQYSWFSADDESIHWFDLSADPYPEISNLVRSFLG